MTERKPITLVDGDRAVMLTANNTQDRVPNNSQTQTGCTGSMDSMPLGRRTYPLTYDRDF